MTGIFNYIHHKSNQMLVNNLVGGWTNPFEKYLSNWKSSPSEKNKNNWIHHLDKGGAYFLNKQISLQEFRRFQPKTKSESSI